MSSDAPATVCSECGGDAWIETFVLPPDPPELRLCPACQPDAAATNLRLRNAMEVDAGMVARLAALLDTLTFRERYIVEMRTGFSMDPEYYGVVFTTQQIATIFKISPQRVGQIATRAFHRLRQRWDWNGVQRAEEAAGE